jgi:hypothetical protein
MQIELKNLKINLAFSEETTMFKADVYVDGVKTAYADNDGHGGCTNYHPYEGMRELLKKAERYAESLPSTFHKFGGTKMEIKSNLEWMIDTMVEKVSNEKEKEKFLKKIAKNFETKIVFGNEHTVSSIGFKGNPKLADMMLIPQGRAAVQNLINRIKLEELKKGDKIYNTNLKNLL